MKKNEQGMVNHNAPSYKQAALQSSNSANTTTTNTPNNSTTTSTMNTTPQNDRSNNNHHHNRNVHHKPKTTTTTTTASSSSNNHHHNNHQTDVIQNQTPLLSFENTDVGNHVVLRLYPTSSNPTSTTLEGEVFAIDPALGMLALFINEGKHASSTRKNFRVVSISQIAEVVSNNKANQVRTTDSSSSEGKFYDTVPFADTSIPLPEIDADDIRRREENAVYERRERLGSNVSSEAQSIFDIMSKTVPCSWKGKQILVMDTIIISPPYGIDNVSGSGNERKRVQNLLQIAYEKIKSNK